MRDVAERVLYRRIRFEVWDIDVIEDQKSNSPWTPIENKSPLHTLSTNVQKAAMVKSLYFEIDEHVRYYSKNANHSILVKLSHSLKNLSNLVDLRIIHGQLPMCDPSEGRIDQVIRFVFNSNLLLS